MANTNHSVLQKRYSVLIATGMALIVALLSLANCIPSPIPTSTPTPTLPAPTRQPVGTYPFPTPTTNPRILPIPPRWLDADPCAPPCVEGIVPGQTTVAEAIQLLESNPLVIPGSIRRVDWFLNVDWKPANYVNWTARSLGLGPDARIGSVTAGYYGFGLADVIAQYGEPTHVMAYAYREFEAPTPAWYGLSLVFLSHGFRIDHDPGHIPPRVDENLRFRDVTFFPIVDEETFLTDGGGAGLESTIARRVIMPWRGEQSFDYYCRDFDERFNANACQTLP